MAFQGTQQKCKACDKTVYLVDQLTADGVIYHKACFRCAYCKSTLKICSREEDDILIVEICQRIISQNDTDLIDVLFVSYMRGNPLEDLESVKIGWIRSH